MSHIMDFSTPAERDAGQGRTAVTIRTARLDDAAGLLKLMRAVDVETPYMIYGKGERSLSVEDVRNLLVEAGLVRGLAMFVAQAGPELAGYTLAVSGGLARTRHCVRISALAVRRRWWRRGVGRAMLTNVEQWARGMGARRLELETMAANDAAQGLYEGMGFELEGRRRRAFLVAGAWMDALVMGKLLED